MLRTITKLLLVGMVIVLLASCCAFGDDDNDVILPGFNQHDQGSSGAT